MKPYCTNPVLLLVIISFNKRNKQTKKSNWWADCTVSAHRLDRLISLFESKHKGRLDKNSLKLQT